MTDIDRYEKFVADCDHMPGADQTLRVSGEVWFRTGGYEAELREHQWDPSVPINPKMLTLDLVVSPPSNGAPEVITCVPVDFSIDSSNTDWDQVDFHLAGVDGDPPETLEVNHLETEQTSS